VHFCQDLGNRNRVSNVGFTAKAVLAFMGLGTEQISLIYLGYLIGFKITFQQFT